MPTRNGKIANLPNDIREQLNLRLLEGETGAELAAWLNALPDVQSVLRSHFNGVPISEVNLTHWRQGGYLQWLTERECFDSARALSEGGCDLATTGLTAERLLNILTLRLGELLMRWDLSPGDGVPDSAAFHEVARKARILQGISRSVLAIHRIQSQSASSKSQREKLTLDSTREAGAPVTKSDFPSHRSIEMESRPKHVERVSAAMEKAEPAPDLGVAAHHLFPEFCGNGAARPEILSGRVSPSSVALNLSHTPFKFDADLNEILTAV